MSNAVKTIGVLTSGGDAPGMNAAIRAVVRTRYCKWITCQRYSSRFCGTFGRRYF